MTAGDDRDRLIGHLLKGTRRLAADSPPDGDCLDTETMAAWLDGGLDEPARMAAVAHAAGCAHCQAMLGAIAQAAPAEAPPLPWWRRQWSSWLVPLTAAAAAVTLWMVVPGQRVSQPPASASFADEPAAPSAAVPPPAAPTALGAADAQPRRQESFSPQPRDAAGPATPATAPAAARDRSKAVEQAPVAAAKEAPPLKPSEPTPVDDFRRRDPDRLANAARPSPDAARPDEAKREEEQRAAEKKDTSDEAKMLERPAMTSKRAAAAPPPAAAAPLGATVAGGRMNVQGTGREVVSPDPAVRWRIAPAAGVQLTLDGGATWVALDMDRAADIAAGSSPARSVCWLVGRRGLVLLTTDGRRFAALPFPEPADLVSVQASGARAASVTAADGRVFATTDGGATWKR